MNLLGLTIRHLHAAATLLVLLAGLATGSNSHAEGNGAMVGSQISSSLFGDYGGLYLLTGKPSPRYELFTWKKLPPEEGLLSSKMRSLAGTIHNRDNGQFKHLNRQVEFTRFAAQNLAVSIPTQGWAQLDPKAQGTGGCLLLSRSNPEMVISLGAEPVGIEAEVTNASLLAASQEKMSSLPNGEVLPGVWTVSAPDIKGLAYQAQATFGNGKQLHYANWIATKNGYSYSLAVYGDQRHGQAVNNTMSQFLRRVRQIQPDHVAHISSQAPLQR